MKMENMWGYRLVRSHNLPCPGQIGQSPRGAGDSPNRKGVPSVASRFCAQRYHPRRLLLWRPRDQGTAESPFEGSGQVLRSSDFRDIYEVQRTDTS